MRPGTSWINCFLYQRIQDRAKWLPSDLLVSATDDTLLARIVSLLSENRVDPVCLNLSDSTFSDKVLALLLRQGYSRSPAC